MVDAIDWGSLFWLGVATAFGSVVTTGMKYVFTDIIRRISLNIWFIRTFDRVTNYSITSKWRGTWEMEWDVVSPNFPDINRGIGRIYCFGSNIAFERTAITRKGTETIYGFVGQLTCQGKVVTGTWFKLRQRDSGYHGAFQLRMCEPDDLVTGAWVGFSDSRCTVNAGEYRLTKLNSSPIWKVPGERSCGQSPLWRLPSSTSRWSEE